MRTKIKVYTLLIISILSAIQCQVETTDQKHFPLSFPVVLPEDPFALPEDPTAITIPEFHSYTEEEWQQFLENLTGTYQAHFNNELITIYININDLVYIMPNNTIITEYTTGNIDNAPGILFFIDENLHIYAVKFSLNSYTDVIGLIALVSDIPLYFSKLVNSPTSNIPNHDEL